MFAFRRFNGLKFDFETFRGNMRREKRPFLVEVKRGQKRPATAADSDFADVKQGTQRRAEEALFGAPAQEAPPQEPASPPRRILEAVAPAPEPQPEIAAPRRGRKPGSRNKEKTTAAIVVSGEKRRRGRPARNPESQVRKVVVTPELTSAALKKIAQFAQSSPLSPVPGAKMTPVHAFEPQPKRKRGRPRKVKPPKFDWAIWTDDEAPPAPGTSERAPAAIATPVAALPPLVRAPRPAALRLRSGERWKRRLRIPGGGPARPRARGA